MLITNNILYVCTENYVYNDIIGITDNTEKAKEIITEYHERYFDVETTKLDWIGKDGIYSCNVVSTSGTIIKKRFAEINPIELNERLF